MSRVRLGSGLSHAAVALLVIPLVVGGLAYAAVNSSALGDLGMSTTHSVAPSPPSANYGMQDRQMLRGHCGNVTAVTLEGTVINVSVGTGEKATIAVKEDDGEIRTVVIGGRWLDPNKTLLTPQELSGKVSVGDHVVITAFIACDGDVRATKIDVMGTTYVMLHGPRIHEFHGHGGWGGGTRAGTPRSTCL